MANGYLFAIHISQDGVVLGLFSDALLPIRLPAGTRETYLLNGANDTRGRLHLEGPEGEFAGEVFDIFHQPRALLRARIPDDLIADVPIGGYARLGV